MPELKTKRKTIPQDLVNEYIKYRNNKKVSKAKLAQLRLKLLKYFELGYVCSSNSPFILAELDVPKSKVNWELEWNRLARNIWKDSWIKRKKQLLKEAPKAVERKVIVKTNPRLAVAQ